MANVINADEIVKKLLLPSEESVKLSPKESCHVTSSKILPCAKPPKSDHLPTGSAAKSPKRNAKNAKWIAESSYISLGIFPKIPFLFYLPSLDLTLPSCVLHPSFPILPAGKSWPSPPRSILTEGYEGRNAALFGASESFQASIYAFDFDVHLSFESLLLIMKSFGVQGILQIIHVPRIKRVYPATPFQDQQQHNTICFKCSIFRQTCKTSPRNTLYVATQSRVISTQFEKRSRRYTRSC